MSARLGDTPKRLLRHSGTNFRPPFQCSGSLPREPDPSGRHRPVAYPKMSTAASGMGARGRSALVGSTVSFQRRSAWVGSGGARRGSARRCRSRGARRRRGSRGERRRRGSRRWGWGRRGSAARRPPMAAGRCRLRRDDGSAGGRVSSRNGSTRRCRRPGVRRERRRRGSRGERRRRGSRRWGWGRRGVRRRWEVEFLSRRRRSVW